MATDIPFSTDDSELILDEGGLSGTTITVLEGMYEIVIDESHPYGYVELDVAID